MIFRLQKIACVIAAVATLAGLVAGRMIPLALALDLFESKVEGSMRFGRWLLALVDGAEDRLNSCYEAWARALVGSPAWRSGVIASGVLGWTSGRFMRAILDVTKHRAKLWSLPAGDLQRRIFVEARSGGASTWANKSIAFLRVGVSTIGRIGRLMVGPCGSTTCMCQAC